MTTPALSARSYAAILGCFFVSGAAGLTYQVAWSKALGLIFGHTVYAVATVLAVFMGGLALGSAWLGRWSERSANAVALYGWVELGVAATGAGSLLGLEGVRRLYTSAHPFVAEYPAGLLALRFFGAALVLLIPTFLMGGTLPILVKGLARTYSELGQRIGRLYWVNTGGAAAGTLAAGFLFLPSLGLRRTVTTAVALNVLAGIVALALGRVGKTTQSSESVAQRTLPHSALLLAFGLVGATAMAYEIAWTRLLATIVGSSTYAFTLMLATFLGGIVLGSMLFEWWYAHRQAVQLSTFAATQTLTAGAALAFLVFFQQLPRVVPPILQATSESFGGLVLAQFVTAALAMLPAAVIFGFNFPLVVVLFAGRSGHRVESGAAVGRAYAANTVGAIAGATLTGFFLVPAIGAFRVVALAAGINLLVAVVLELRSEPAGETSRRPLALGATLGLAAALAVAAFSTAFYNRSLATFGTLLYWDLYEGKLTPAETADTTDILFAADGLNASISVARAEDYLALRTNGKVDASSRDRITQLLAGHLGPIFHPAPRRVLIIGFGSGMTVSAVARYPEVARIDCVEIEPAVIEAAAYLEPLHRGVLRDPRLRVILDDARNFLLTSRDQYDVIISEPSNPWIAGVASLFTDEFYRSARARLAPGGLFVQWVQAYSLYPEDLGMVFATFAAHFPRVTLWHGDSPDLFLLGQHRPEQLTLERFRGLWSNPLLRADYEALGLRQPEGLVAFYWLDDAGLRQLAANIPRNSDDHTLLEYRAPRALLVENLLDKNLEMLRPLRTSLLPRDLAAGEPHVVLAATAATLLNLEERKEAGRFVEALADAPATASLELLRARWADTNNQIAPAEAAYRKALQLDPRLVEAAVGLAKIARRRGQEDTAELLLRRALARNPAFLPALDAIVSLERDHGRFLHAAEWQQKRIAADPQASADQHARLGELFLRAGDVARAEQALQSALRRDPYTFDAHSHLAELARVQRRPSEALKHLEFIVRYFPDYDARAYLALAQLYRDSGDARAASRVLRKGRRIFPTDQELARIQNPR